MAAGKTVKRILVGYDNPNGPASFKGWLDDIRIVGDPGSATKAHLSDYVLTNRGTNSTGDFHLRRDQF